MQRQTDKSRPLRECREVAGRHIFIHPIHSHVDSNVSRFCRDQHLFFDLPRKTGFVMAIGCRPIRVERHRWKPPKVAPPPDATKTLSQKDERSGSPDDAAYGRELLVQQAFRGRTRFRGESSGRPDETAECPSHSAKKCGTNESEKTRISRAIESERTRKSRAIKSERTRKSRAIESERTRKCRAIKSERTSR